MAFAHILTPILEAINEYLGILEWCKKLIRTPQDMVLGMVQDKVTELKTQAQDLQGMAEEGIAFLGQDGIVEKVKEHIKQNAESETLAAIGSGILARTASKYRNWQERREREKVITSFSGDPSNQLSRFGLFKEARESVSLDEYFFEEEHRPLNEGDVAFHAEVCFRQASVG